MEAVDDLGHIVYVDGAVRAPWYRHFAPRSDVRATVAYDDTNGFEAGASAITEEHGAAGQPECAPLQSNKRRRKNRTAGQSHEQDQQHKEHLDARFPGNAQQRPIIDHLTAVHAMFMAWWRNRSSQLIHSSGQQQQQQHGLVTSGGHEGGHDVSDDAGAGQGPAIHAAAATAHVAAEPSPGVDWVALVDAYEADLKRQRKTAEPQQALQAQDGESSPPGGLDDGDCVESGANGFNTTMTSAAPVPAAAAAPTILFSEARGSAALPCMRMQPLLGATVEGPGAAQRWTRTVKDESSGPSQQSASHEVDAGTEVEALAHGTRVLLPAACRFLMSSLKHIAPLTAEGRRYQCVVADPPWENRSVARGGGGYATLATLQLLALPLAQLVDPVHGLVALWITNRLRVHQQLHQHLLPAWGLTHVATWYWLKVDVSGEPVIPLTCMHRHPYEQILLLRPTSTVQPVPPASGASAGPAATTSSRRPDDHASDAGCGGDDGGSATFSATPAHTVAPNHGVPDIPDGITIISTPGTHSRKPPIGPLLYRYCSAAPDAAPHNAPVLGRQPALPPPPGCACLELFARELQPGWTSWGNEVLKFQELATCFDPK